MSGRRFTLICLGLFILIQGVFAQHIMMEQESEGESQQHSQQQRILPECMVETGSEVMYGISVEHGFLYSTDSGVTWLVRNEGLPKRNLNLEGIIRPRLLTALGVEPGKPERVIVATPYLLYLSEDYGNSWKPISIWRSLPGGAYVTAVALSPLNKEAIIIGTSFNGIFESIDGGKTWKSISKNYSFLYQGVGFWEEVNGLAYHPTETGAYFFSCGFGKGVYSVPANRREAHAVELSLLKGQIITGMAMVQAVVEETYETDEWLLKLRTGKHSYSYALQGGYWKINNLSLVDFVSEEAIAKRERLKRASGRNGIYLQPTQARGKLLDKHIRFIKDNNLNAIVVDFKDDLGNLTYDTKLPLPRQIGAVRNLINSADLIKKAKENDIYVIARVVVFKDKKLYAYESNKYSTWDKTDDKPWGNLVKTGKKDEEDKDILIQKEFWVDPYCDEVWKYNLAVAEELQTLGVDEIQFDYIRFPTDGKTSQILYRYRREGMTKSDALESFLALARSRIAIPISTDLYGFNCWYRMEGWTGQNIRVFSDYVDVICPMYYPSHFPSKFLLGGTYLERAQQIYREGTYRAKIITDGNCVIRPYVQAFLMGKELRMKAPEYSEYLNNQVRGIFEVDYSSGFTLWNNSNRYYMVNDSLKEIIPPNP